MGDGKKYINKRPLKNAPLEKNNRRELKLNFLGEKEKIHLKKRAGERKINNII